MKKYAEISGNYVSNIIAAESKEEAELVIGSTLIEIAEGNPAGIGFTYDSETGLFVNPYPPIEEVSPLGAPVE